MIGYQMWRNQRIRERLLEQVPVPNAPTTVNGVQGYQQPPGNAAYGQAAPQQTPQPPVTANMTRPVTPQMKNAPPVPPQTIRSQPPAPPAGVTGDEDPQAQQQPQQGQQPQPTQPASTPLKTTMQQMQGQQQPQQTNTMQQPQRQPGTPNPAAGSGSYFGNGATRFSPSLRTNLAGQQSAGTL